MDAVLTSAIPYSWRLSELSPLFKGKGIILPGVKQLLKNEANVPHCVVQWLSSQICNVCALLETSTKCRILVDMVVTITTGYRTTSTAPPGAWWRHLLNVGTFCHTSLHNFGSKRIFFTLFSDLYPGDVD